MEIQSISHTALLVEDIEQSIHFYRHILGMEQLHRPNSHSSSSSGAWFRKGSAEIHLISEKKAGRVTQISSAFSHEEQSHGYCPHIAFEVSNLKRALSHLHLHSIAVAGGPYLRADGARLVYIQDPDGHVIELVTPNKEK